MASEVCEKCGRPAERRRSMYVLQGNGIPKSFLACEACCAEWLGLLKPKRAEVLSTASSARRHNRSTTVYHVDLAQLKLFEET